MKGKKLFQLLSSLSKEEFKLVAKALKSPLWNTNDRIIKVYDQIKPYYPVFDLTEKHHHRIYTATFDQASYDDYKFRRLLSDLTKIVERFLIQLEVEHDPRESNRLLLKALGRRNVYNHFEKGTLQELQAVGSGPYQDMEYYQSLIGLHYDLYFHPLTNRHSKNDDHLAALINAIDSNYVLAKLRVGSELKNREKMLNTQYENKLEPAILGEFGHTLQGQNPVYQMYKLVYQLFAPPQEMAAFAELKILFTKDIEALRQVDQFFILHHLINFAARQINAGRADFYKEALDLYKTGLEQNLLLENNKMREATYGNIILLGCQAKEFAWVDEFIGIYSVFLDPEIREDAKAHALGLRYFYQKDFPKAVDQLLHYKFSPAYQPRVRIIIIRSLFEQFLKDHSIFSLLQAQCDAFEKYISRNDFLAKPRLEPHLNTTRLIRKLAQLLFEKEEKESIQKWLNQELISRKKFLSQTWLKEKSKNLK